MTTNKLKIKSFKKINGLFYIEDIKIDLDSIVCELYKKNWIPLTKSYNSRKVQHYGFKYGYRSYKIHEKTTPIPDFMNKIKNRLTKICQLKNIIDKDYEFNQCIVNNYQGSQGISKHIDVKSYGPVIGCYTAGSGGVMRFRLGNEVVDVYTKPNSLYIMSGDARYKWTHEMPYGSYDMINNEKVNRGRRVSITFRNVCTKN